MSLLEVKNLTVHCGTLKLVDDLSFSLEEGQWLMIIGPNGAGKSTMINAISQCISYTGSVCSAGRDLARQKSGERAKLMGVLAQGSSVSFPFSVAEVVRLGRYAYAPGIFSKLDSQSETQVQYALEATGLSELSDRSVLTLSGGELQRMFLAQVLAQDPRILLLDEPTNHLDLVYQKQSFELIDNWRKEKGRACISVVHDLSLAKKYGTDAILLDHGKTIASGSIQDVFKPEFLETAYSIDVHDWMRSLLSQWS